MDILHLIDRLENILTESRRLPLTASLLVDEDRITNIIDQMRVSIPEAIKRAERIEAEREKILAQANEEAARIRELARQEAEEMVNRHAVVGQAERKADRVIQKAYADADRIKVGADEYSLSVLAQLEQDMVRSLRVVQNGLHRLEREMQVPLPENEVEEEISAHSTASGQAETLLEQAESV